MNYLKNFVFAFHFSIANSQSEGVLEAFFAQGYKGDLKWSSSKSLVEYVSKQYPGKTVLDVGCSHGKAVELFWMKNITSFGIDKSEKAILNASVSKKTYQKCKPFPCFQVGTAVDLPFHNKSVDVVLSSFTLEYLNPFQIKTAAREFQRVAKVAILIKVPLKKRSVSKPSQSFFSKQEWISFFKTVGMQIRIIYCNDKFFIFECNFSL